MAIVLAIFLATLTSADMCEKPVAGGVGEPRFCRFYEATVISTPFFSFVAEPDLLVGIHRGGTRAVVEASIRQSPAGLVIEAYPHEHTQQLLEELGRCGDQSGADRGIIVCDRSSEGISAKTYLIQGHSGPVLVQYAVSDTAIDLEVAFKRMVSSIDADVTSPDAAPE